MNINLDDLSSLVYKETLKVISETLDSQMGDNDEERDRQKQQSDIVQKRGLNASDTEDDDIQKEQEDDTTDKELETGIPEPEVSSEEESAPRKDRTGGKGTADSPKLDTPSKKQIEKVTVGSVIDKLNALRGGKSLKDPEVKKSFNQYFNALDTSQRKTLLVFLTGVAQILSGVAQGDDAINPQDVGIQTDIKKKPAEKKSSKKKKTSGAAHPGSETNPIVVGESKSRTRASIKNAIKAYRRNK